MIENTYAISFICFNYAVTDITVYGKYSSIYLNVLISAHPVWYLQISIFCGINARIQI
ncbi:protein of unknown function [Candidatus Nitrosocosmicus franklandus]|uniref:Uncharacterized protein n=1 Tax=Candidatus Nitrosocosmicus franklandianus TaxID=1798806 RepID=A0A484IDQ7_9ARCH|nr:protein of unknown function [Candidatus Nitrosocosmicus franklandus]